MATMGAALEFQKQLDSNRAHLNKNQLKKQRRKMKEMFQQAASGASDSTEPSAKRRRPGKRGRSAAAASTKSHMSTTMDKAVLVAAQQCNADAALVPNQDADFCELVHEQSEPKQEAIDTAGSVLASCHTAGKGSDARATERKKRKRKHRQLHHAGDQGLVLREKPKRRERLPSVEPGNSSNRKGIKHLEVAVDAVVNTVLHQSKTTGHVAEPPKNKLDKEAAAAGIGDAVQHAAQPAGHGEEPPRKKKKREAKTVFVTRDALLHTSQASSHGAEPPKKKTKEKMEMDVAPAGGDGVPVVHAEVWPTPQAEMAGVERTKRRERAVAAAAAAGLSTASTTTVLAIQDKQNARPHKVDRQEDCTCTTQVHNVAHSTNKVLKTEDSAKNVSAAVASLLRFVPRSCRVGGTMGTKPAAATAPSASPQSGASEVAQTDSSSPLDTRSTATVAVDSNGPAAGDKELKTATGTGPTVGYKHLNATTSIGLAVGDRCLAAAAATVVLASRSNKSGMSSASWFSVARSDAGSLASAGPATTSNAVVVCTETREVAAVAVKVTARNKLSNAIGNGTSATINCLSAATERSTRAQARGAVLVKSSSSGADTVGRIAAQGLQQGTPKGVENGGAEREDGHDMCGVESDARASGERTGMDGAGVETGVVKRKHLRTPYVHGNYHRYYGYRLGGASQDPRMKVLDAAWFQGKRCIDVGCNEGLFTLEVATNFRCKSMLGVDIDAGLIGKACRHLAETRSKLTTQLTGRQALGPFGCSTSLSRLRSSIEALTGTAFLHEEWVHAPATANSADVVMCLSVTKWVHFHWGDKGVKRLFAKVVQVLAPGGVFVLEPQRWDSYQKARKKPFMLQVPFKDLTALQLRPEQFVSYLTNHHGMQLLQELYPGGEGQSEGGFNRPVYVMQKGPKAV